MANANEYTIVVGVNRQVNQAIGCPFWNPTKTSFVVYQDFPVEWRVYGPSARGATQQARYIIKY